MLFKLLHHDSTIHIAILNFFTAWGLFTSCSDLTFSLYISNVLKITSNNGVVLKNIGSNGEKLEIMISQELIYQITNFQKFVALDAKVSLCA